MNFVLEINIYPHKITLEQTPKLVQINRSIGIGQIVVYRFPILHTFNAFTSFKQLPALIESNWSFHLDAKENNSP